MLNSNDFDLWSGEYDKNVLEMDAGSRYPFAGYNELMAEIYAAVMGKSPAHVLDIGFGTATLTQKLYQGGNNVTGIDFSDEMIKIAQEKMPDAKLMRWDFTKGIPSELSQEKFDFIISTYALHHLTDTQKVDFLKGLLELLHEGGRILIGDVCFNTRAELENCKSDCGDAWDDDEIYFVFSELSEKLHEFCTLSFHKFSFCSGVIGIHQLLK